MKVLAEAGLVRVVRTRRVRAIDEAYYGRTARMFTVALDGSAGDDGGQPYDFNDFEVAAGESGPAYAAGQLWGFIRHARIDEHQKEEFWQRMKALVDEFDTLPRHGDIVHGFAIGIYPIPDHPRLPDTDE